MDNPGVGLVDPDALVATAVRTSHFVRNRGAARGSAAAVRYAGLTGAMSQEVGLRGDRDATLVGLLDGPATWAFELGRLAPNRPLPRPGRRRQAGAEGPRGPMRS